MQGENRLGDGRSTASIHRKLPNEKGEQNCEGRDNICIRYRWIYHNFHSNTREDRIE